VVVFGGCDQQLRVISAADGGERDVIDAGSYIPASPVIAGGRAFVAHAEGELLSVDLGTGEVLWRYDLNAGKAEDAQSNGFFSTPAVDAERVVAGAQDEKVHCVDRKTGRKLWTFATRGNVDSSPAICGPKVVVGSDDGRLYVLSAADGRKVWSYELGGAISSSPAVWRGALVVGCDDGYVYAFVP